MFGNTKASEHKGRNMNLFEGMIVSVAETIQESFTDDTLTLR